MKKTIKLLGLLLVAAALFTSCDFGKEEEKKDGDLCEPLFDLSETKITTYTIELSDGDWTYRDYEKDDGNITSYNFFFTVKNGKLDTKADYSFVEQRLYTEVSTYVIDSLMKNGYEGDELFWYREADKSKVNKIVAKDTSTDPFESKIQWLYRQLTKDGEWSMIASDLKTNTDKSKYSWSPYENSGGYFHYSYLAKD